MPTLAENLRRIRKEKRLSQGKLAQISGVSQQLISQIERGVNTTTKELPQLARALQVAASDLDENFKPEAIGDKKELLDALAASELSDEMYRALLAQVQSLLGSRNPRNDDTPDNGQQQAS